MHTRSATSERPRGTRLTTGRRRRLGVILAGLALAATAVAYSADDASAAKACKPGKPRTSSS